MPELFNTFYQYSPDGISFSSKDAARMRTIYFPLCGVDAKSLKSAITPYLSGDIKTDKNHFLTKPASREDLRLDVRNFFFDIENKGVFSFAQCGGPESTVEAGPLWHKVVRIFPEAGLQLEAINFVPISSQTVELMSVTVKNISNQNFKMAPTAAIPIFARGLSNKHDHEHVTALLHRIKQVNHGVLVSPTMYFNEEGHKPKQTVYFVYGISEKGANPIGTFPTTESFYGDCGNPFQPLGVSSSIVPDLLTDEMLQGKEAMGALRFPPEVLSPGDSRRYLLILGLADNLEEAEKVFKEYASLEKFEEALKDNKQFWFEKTHAIELTTADLQFNAWFKWVTLQPVLRRIFGNSFLPDHDYGKGGKGWRDIWQDLLSLILIEPEHVRENLIDNYAGVRIDGSNATIIGNVPGEFIADRNAITRVWMDHGVWPYLTTKLYIDQTGDYDILLEENTYFRDTQLSRTFQKDFLWNLDYGRKLKDHLGQVYAGSVLEHILVQHLVQFFNVGEHNIIRLESADWNDGLDMAFRRGESVAFASFYAGNLLSLAHLLEEFSRKKAIKELTLAKELLVLLDSLTESPCDYHDPEAKKYLLFNQYLKSVQPEISGQTVKIPLESLVADLRKKGMWIFEHIRRQEKVKAQEGPSTYSWFNGYYDNQGERVDGERNNRVQMTLTGQVFPFISGLANEEEIKDVIRTVNHYLKDSKLGGYHLNTDFCRPHYLDLGRAFSFAYGTKENGAFFSHMNVMYAYGLYLRGFAREGHEVLETIYKMSTDTAKSKIYPGIPEYFDPNGQGMYHYLTGSASWFVLTLLTQVFGVRGEGGDLVLNPKLLKEQFGTDNTASISCQFAGKKLNVVYVNASGLDFGQYAVKEVLIDGKNRECEKKPPAFVKIPRDMIQPLSQEVQIRVVLG